MHPSGWETCRSASSTCSGSSCCGADDFAAAVELVGRRRDEAAPLVTHQFTLEQAPEAIAYAMAHPAEVMKAVVRLDAP